MFYELILVNAAGSVVKTLHCERLFGRIEYQGRWFASKRLKASPMPEHVFVEEEPRS